MMDFKRLIRRFPEKRGFTLIELIVSLCISMLVISGVAAYILHSNKMSVYSFRQFKVSEDSKRIFNEIIDGTGSSRTGLRQAGRYDIGDNAVAYQVGETIRGYRLEDSVLYRVEGLANVAAPSTGGDPVLDNVKIFDIQDDTETGMLTVKLVTEMPSPTAMKIGVSLETKVKPRGLSKDLQSYHGPLPCHCAKNSKRLSCEEPHRS